MSRYAELAELYTHGAPSSAFGTLTDPQRLNLLEGASGELDSAIKSQGPIPLLAVPMDLVMKICHIAAYEGLALVGFNPNAGADTNYLVRAQVARDYFRGIARGEQKPAVTFASPRRAAQPHVTSTPKRGW